MKEALLLRGGLLIFIFIAIFSCKKNPPEKDPEALSTLYVQRVLTFSEGFRGCVNFSFDYGFVIDSKGEKRRPKKEEVETYCNLKRKGKIYRGELKVVKLYRNDKLGKANYEIWVYSTRMPYVKELSFEKVEGIWRFYLE